MELNDKLLKFEQLVNQREFHDAERVGLQLLPTINELTTEQQAKTYTLLASVFREKYEYDTSLDFIDKAIALEPENAVTYVNRGVLYMDINAFDQALADYEKALEIDGLNPAALTNIAAIHRSRGDYEKAREMLEKVLDSQYEDSSVYNNLALTYSEQGEYVKALDYFEKALKFDPNNFYALSNLAIAYKNIKQYDEAIRLFEKAMPMLRKQSQELYRTYHILGSIYLEKGDLIKGEELLLQSYYGFLEISPKNSFEPYLVLVNLALLNNSLGKRGVALSQITKSYEKLNEILGPEHPITKDIRSLRDGIVHGKSSYIVDKDTLERKK